MLSLANLIVILFIILLIFGAGRVPEIMSNLAKGLKIFKSTLSHPLPKNTIDQKKKDKNKSISKRIKD